MDFYGIRAGQASVFFNGEWEPYPRDLYRLHTDPAAYAGQRIRVRTGTRPGDMIFSAFNVVSDRFVQVLSDCKASGFDVFSAPLVKGEQQIAAFYGLLVSGRGGAFDPVRSRAEFSSTAVMGYAGIYMDERGWDGSDVFFIPGLGIGLYVTERVATAIRRARLRNVRIMVNTACRL